MVILLGVLWVCEHTKKGVANKKFPSFVCDGLTKSKNFPKLCMCGGGYQSATTPSN